MRRTTALILALAALAGPAAVGTAAARADGDPAAVVLASDPVFDPADAGGSPAQVAQLEAAVRAGAPSGFPLRVALIASAGDLGTIIQYWGDPYGYARYLGAELASGYRGPTLVVMPQGYALWVNTSASRAEQRALAGLSPPGADLVASARRVVQRLSADNGVPPTSGAGPAGSGPGAASDARSGPSGSVVGLIGFLAGLGAVAGAWTLSLRARPLRSRPRTVA